MFSKIGKGIKKFMSDRVEVCKEIIQSNGQVRITTGLIVIAVGIGVVCVGGALIASAYIKAPQF